MEHMVNAEPTGTNKQRLQKVEERLGKDRVADFVQTVQKLWDQRVGLQDTEHYFVKLEKDSPRYKDVVAA